MKVVINRCYGGFGLSDAAYEKLIEWGVPVRAWAEEARDPKTRRVQPRSENDGEVIFDNALSDEPPIPSRYWDTWTRDNRSHPLLVRVVEELGSKASDKLARLCVVEIPDDVEWTIEEYDGYEHVAEVHRTWP